MSAKPITEEELLHIPWLELPAEVRTRVCERAAQLHGDTTLIEQERAEADLADLSAYRLIKAHGGNVRKAIAYAKKHRTGDKPPYPACVIGSSQSQWRAAYYRTYDRLLYPSPETRAQYAQTVALVLEEMNKLNR
jgi:hypothetical protein